MLPLGWCFKCAFKGYYTILASQMLHHGENLVRSINSVSMRPLLQFFSCEVNQKQFSVGYHDDL